MLDSRKGKDVAWGNRLGFILLPLHITSYNDPLEYIRKAKKMADRKKFSLEVLFTHAVVEITTKLLGAKVYLRQMYYFSFLISTLYILVSSGTPVVIAILYKERY